MDAVPPHFSRHAPALRLIVVILVSFPTVGATGGSSDAKPNDNVADADSLEAFKGGISMDPTGVLRSWDKGAPGGICSWSGIRCNSVKRVTGIELAGRGLGGRMNILPGGLQFLSELNLSNNSLAGVIPFELGYLSGLQRLWLDLNSITGSIPISLLSLENLTSLDLSRNLLTGEIPVSIGNLTKLSYLNLRSNGLNGSIPESLGNCSSLKSLDLGNNMLSGKIPDALPKLLLRLDLSNNSLSGSIPLEGINQTKLLQVLLLSWNELIGAIPPTLGNLANLTLIDLQRNKLEGSIPDELQGLQQLVVLSLAHNKLVGELASSPWLQKLTSLQVLLLSNNPKIGGNIPDELGLMAGFQNPVRNRRVLYQEEQIGRPTVSYILESTGVLDLSYDGLWGSIPPDLGNLTGLRYLNLSSNYLFNTIPGSLGSLTSVNIMDLSTNNLAGTVPQNLTSLRYFSAIGNERLEGSVQFGALDISAYTRNRQACIYSTLYLLSPPCDYPLPPQPAAEHPMSVETNEPDESFLAKQVFNIGFIWGFSLGLGFTLSFIFASETGKSLVIPHVEVATYQRIYGAYISPYYDKIVYLAKSAQSIHRASTHKCEEGERTHESSKPSAVIPVGLDGEDGEHEMDYIFPNHFEIIPLGLD